MSLEAEKSAVKSLLDEYITSVENADIELYATTVAHDPDMVNFGTDASQRIVGWAALRDVMQAQNAALSGTKITQSDVTISVSPDERQAWATSLWEFKATVGGQAVELPVRCTWVLEKRQPGWEIVHFHKSVGTTG